MSRESDRYFFNSHEDSNYINYQIDFVNPQEVSIRMSMCLNIIARFGPSFAHFVPLILKFC